MFCNVAYKTLVSSYSFKVENFFEGTGQKMSRNIVATFKIRDEERPKYHHHNDHFGAFNGKKES